MGAGLCSGLLPYVPPVVSASARSGWNPSLATHSPVSGSQGEACSFHSLCGGPLTPWSSRLPSPGPVTLTPAPQPPHVFRCDRSEGHRAYPPRQEIPAFLGASAKDGFTRVLGSVGLLALGPGFSPTSVYIGGPPL